jgi:NAD(P)-dependent dehydrogenase (short-subunit alcohol dehydrogenase family)
MQVLITGATDGLGKRVAELLAGRGEDVIVHGRSPDRVEAVAREIGAAGAYVADLASLEEVRRLAVEVRSDREQLHALINNAGLYSSERRESEDGHELGFAVNYLAHFLLTLELLPLLESSSPARIVNVSSVGQREIDFDDMMLERDYDGFRSYSQSKLAQIMFTFELAQRLGPESGVTVDALHPASLMDTKMVRESLGSSRTSVDEGADAVVTVLDDRDGSGRYFNGIREGRALDQAYDPDARSRVWELSEELTGVRAPFGIQH